MPFRSNIPIPQLQKCYNFYKNILNTNFSVFGKKGDEGENGLKNTFISVL